MTKLDEVATWLADHLPALLAEHDVPAAGVAVLAGGEVVDAAAGLLSTATGVEATPDSLFQIGSITKVWTATLVLQLVDEGLVGLDDRLQQHLPGFRLADGSAAATMTVRQLLSHTAGFEGDVFTDTGRGDDRLERYVDGLADLPQLFPPGEQFSYNNAGYCVLGRLVEVLRGRPFDECLAEHLFAPLGLTHAAASPYEAILFRTAVGHLSPEPDGGQVPAPMWAMAPSNAPAGSMLAMRPRDLLTFARAHLDGGTASDGTRVLAAETVAAMQQPQVQLPDIRVMGDSWGLGWELFDTMGTPVVGHDGNTIGQASFLRVLPEHGVAVVLLTNGGDPYGLYRDVVGHVLRELAGVELRPLPVPPADPQPVDASRYAGTYSSQVADLVVSQDGDGRIWLEMRPKGLALEIGETPERSELVDFAPDTLIPVQPQSGLHVPLAFLGDDGAGRARFVHVGRAVPRAVG
ncbi:serine hydrolase domain-containing protein [Modestobacter versicolor]|uniref:CubicO group peptidase (Beta-lactamase class C family) n=1 Tax=Modestobacter versicolor TaxID=429133 RepID=A0A323VCD4_9ACTN|nr:serine hydrolase domain-containing protein [Modestobacter versicolor]MBB3678285.1 CubicO group peptidase (beta-lactamase class C family) [Modestobacter versicolor]PZA22397.1 serine hydrolase [Modestobacter versicolor]